MKSFCGNFYRHLQFFSGHTGHSNNDLREEELQEVVHGLFSDHDDGQLDAELVNAPGRVAYVTTEPGEDTRVHFVAGMREKFSLQKIMMMIWHEAL